MVSQSVSQSVSKSWCRVPFGDHDQIFITVCHLRSCFCGAPSLTRGRICLLYMLLALTSAVFLGSESLGTRDRLSTGIDSRAEQSSSLLPATNQHGRSWHRARLGPMAIYLFNVKIFFPSFVAPSLIKREGLDFFL
jgi:hypothetical protein